MIALSVYQLRFKNRTLISLFFSLMFSRWISYSILLLLEYEFMAEENPNVRQIKLYQHDTGSRSVSFAENVGDETFQNNDDFLPTATTPWRIKNPDTWLYFFPFNVSVVLSQVPSANAINLGIEYTQWDRLRWKALTHTSRPQYRKHRIKRRDQTKHIRRIWIWGERNSCTTAITMSLLKNFDLDCQNSETNQTVNVESECIIGGLPWKHDFMRRADLSMQNETLNILVTRHPYEWTDSMHRAGYGADFHSLHNRRTFLTLEWMAKEEESVQLSRYIRHHPPTRLQDFPKEIAGPPSFSMLGDDDPTAGSTSSAPKLEMHHSFGSPANQNVGNVHERGKSTTRKVLRNTSTLPQCTPWVRAEILDAMACQLQDTVYICTPLPGGPPSHTREDSPMNGCLAGRYSYGACSPAMWLCQHGHKVLELLDPSVKRAVVLDSTFQNVDTIVGFLYRQWNAALDLVHTPVSLVLNLVERASDVPVLVVDQLDQDSEHRAGEHSTRMEESNFSASSRPPDPCHRDEEEAASILPVEGHCSHQGRVYHCEAVPGLNVSSGDEAAPSRHCLDGDLSWNVCEEGRFLCEVGAAQPWDAGPSAPTTWLQWLDLARPWMEGDASRSSWNARIPSVRLRGVQELASDRDPGTGGRFPTPLAMREAKLRDWLRVSPRLDFASHISCRDFLLDPAEVLADLQRVFGLRKKASIKDQEWQLTDCVWLHGKCVSTSENFEKAKSGKVEHYLSGKYMSSFSDQDLRITNAWLDPELEARFEYKLFDSVKDAARPYTRESRYEYLPVRDAARPYTRENRYECLLGPSRRDHEVRFGKSLLES